VFVPFITGTYEIALAEPVPRVVGDSYTAGALSAALRETLRVHVALCHPGATRLDLSNIVMNGRRVRGLREPHECRGCRLAHKKPVSKRSSRQAPRLDPRESVEEFGNVAYSDHSCGFPKSWPHGFTSWVNFCDKHTKQRAFYFTVTRSSAEVASALRSYVKDNQHRLRNGKVKVWVCDGAKELAGNLIDGDDGAASHLAVQREFSVPYISNTNPVAERARRPVAFETGVDCARWRAGVCVALCWCSGVLHLRAARHDVARPTHVAPRLRQPGRRRC